MTNIIVQKIITKYKVFITSSEPFAIAIKSKHHHQQKHCGIQLDNSLAISMYNTGWKYPKWSINCLHLPKKHKQLHCSPQASHTHYKNNTALAYNSTTTHPAATLNYKQVQQYVSLMGNVFSWISFFGQ